MAEEQLRKAKLKPCTWAGLLDEIQINTNIPWEDDFTIAPEGRTPNFKYIGAAHKLIGEEGWGISF
jgi:hypothetical protein